MESAHNRGASAIALAVLLALGVVVVALTVGSLRKPTGLARLLHAKHVIVELRSGRYKAAPAIADGSGGEEFAAMIRRLKPYAAISGTFYDDDYRPQGDLVCNGRLLCRGHHRQGVGFTSSGRIVFLERKPNSRINWRGCRSGMAAGPRLVRNGEVRIDVKRDGFGRAAATLKASRCALGATSDGKLIMCVVSEPITLSMMGYVMLDLGARDAVNLDGGGSCALYSDGRFLVEPQRPVSNIMAVYRH